MGTITKKKVNIYIVDADRDVNTLNGSDVLKGEIREYALSGGDQEFETENVFGGQIDIINPRDQFELELTIRPNMEHVERFKSLSMGSFTIGGETFYSPSLDGEPQLVVIEAIDGSNKETWALNNARNVTFNFSHNADESREGTISMGISPEDGDGVPQVISSKTDVDGFPTWAAIKAEFDAS